MINSKELCEIIIEFYNHKEHIWNIVKITKVIDYKYDKNANMIITFIYDNKINNIILPYGRILNYDMLNMYAEIDNLNIEIKKISDNPVLCKGLSNRNRFKKIGYNLQQQFDFGGGKSEWLQLTTEMLEKYQVKQAKSLQENVGLCLVEAKQKGLNYLRENLWIYQLMKVF